MRAVVNHAFLLSHTPTAPWVIAIVFALACVHACVLVCVVDSEANTCIRDTSKSLRNISES